MLLMPVPICCCQGAGAHPWGVNIPGIAPPVRLPPGASSSSESLRIRGPRLLTSLPNCRCRSPFLHEMNSMKITYLNGCLGLTPSPAPPLLLGRLTLRPLSNFLPALPGYILKCNTRPSIMTWTRLERRPNIAPAFTQPNPNLAPVAWRERRTVAARVAR